MSRPVFNALSGVYFVTAAQLLLSVGLLEKLARSSPNVDAAKVVANRIRDIFAGADLEKVMSVFMVEIRTSFFSLAENGFYCSSGFTNSSEGIGVLNVLFQSCVSIWTSSGYSRSTAKFRRRGKSPLSKIRARPWFGRGSVWIE